MSINRCVPKEIILICLLPPDSKLFVVEFPALALLVMVKTATTPG